MEFTINKVWMPQILGFKGYGWEIREHTKKIIVDCLPTKKAAQSLVKKLDAISKYKNDGLGRAGSDWMIPLLPIKERYSNLFN